MPQAVSGMPTPIPSSPRPSKTTNLPFPNDPCLSVQASNKYVKHPPFAPERSHLGVGLGEVRGAVLVEGGVLAAGWAEGLPAAVALPHSTRVGRRHPTRVTLQALAGGTLHMSHYTHWPPGGRKGLPAAMACHTAHVLAAHTLHTFCDTGRSTSACGPRIPAW